MKLTDGQVKMMQEEMYAELIQILMEKYAYTMEQAMDTVYSSHTFEKVERTSTGLFYQGSVYVMDMLREELEAT